MYTIKKKFMFSASHQLEGLAKDHPCTTLHGHNYEITITLGAVVLDEIGMVFDYRRLDAFKNLLNERFDHQHLNTRMEINPTAENMAKVIFEMALESIPKPVEVLAISVKETEKTEAIYEPGY